MRRAEEEKTREERAEEEESGEKSRGFLMLSRNVLPMVTVEPLQQQPPMAAGALKSPPRSEHHMPPCPSPLLYLDPSHAASSEAGNDHA